MKKLVAIMLTLLMLAAFVACVDNSGDMDGDVKLPSKETESSSVESSGNNPTGSGNGGIYVDSNGEINLPKHEFD